MRITTSFFSGMLSGTANYTGGFVGRTLSHLHVSASYFRGSIHGPSYVGVFTVASEDSTSIHIESSYMAGYSDVLSFVDAPSDLKPSVNIIHSCIGLALDISITDIQNFRGGSGALCMFTEDASILQDWSSWYYEPSNGKSHISPSASDIESLSLAPVWDLSSNTPQLNSTPDPQTVPVQVALEASAASISIVYFSLEDIYGDGKVRGPRLRFSHLPRESLLGTPDQIIWEIEKSSHGVLGRVESDGVTVYRVNHDVPIELSVTLLKEQDGILYRITKSFALVVAARYKGRIF